MSEEMSEEVNEGIEEEPVETPYTFQPFGAKDREHYAANRLFGVSGIHPLAVIQGLTLEEAELIVWALRSAGGDPSAVHRFEEERSRAKALQRSRDKLQVEVLELRRRLGEVARIAAVDQAQAQPAVAGVEEVKNKMPTEWDG